MGARRDGTEPQIQHGRVFLRPPEREDVPLFVSWFNDWRTVRTLGRRGPMARWAEDRWFDGMPDWWGRSDYMFVACLLEDDRPIGNCGLHEIDRDNGSAMLGIAIGRPEDRGRGHGTEMLQALVGFGFDQLRLERIWLDVYATNPGARRVYERVGFVHEGTLRHAVFREGQHLDVVRMSILGAEWRAQRAGDGADPR
jgi:RimJ/RimL family protein N-acetyltransferase